MTKVSIIGSGGMASAIAGLAWKAGHDVEIMSRNRSNARALADQIGGATVGEFGGAPRGDIVFLAVPYAVVLDVVKLYGGNLANKLIVDLTNPVGPDLVSFVTPADSFGALEIARAAPADAIVVKAFNGHFSHVVAAGPEFRVPVDVFIAGDDAPAKQRVSDFTTSLGLRPLDVGALPMARTLEHLCLLSLGLIANATRHTDFAIGVSLPD
jgi:8-hydroxy-5-deazaflavin:NADPH oxidoreductase